MPSDEMLPSVELLVKEDGKSTDEFSAHNSLCQFSFNPGGIVAVQENAMILFIWDPGITFKFKALVGTVNTKLPPLLLGSTGTFGFIDYANSMTLVWDPGLQRCMHSSVLLFVLALAAVTSLNFSSRDIFPKWAVSYKMVVLESKVDDTYSEMNRVFDDSFHRVVSRVIQSIALLDIIRLPKLFRFLQQLLAQLIFVLQAPKSKVEYAAIRSDFSLRKKIIEQATTVCIAWLQGCIKPIKDLIEQQLHNFYTLDKILAYFDTQGVPACYATGHDLEFQYILNGYSADQFISLIMQAILDSGDKIGCPPTLPDMKIVRLSKKEQMTILRIMASVMILGDWEFSKGSGVVSSIQQVDRLWFHLCSTITTLYTNSVLGRFNIILPAWFY
ncbi:hypothetical protein MTR67_007747 [Solanum verrucosum]|uniref:Uncharacterized protein n=1 Tax=Solanum verrucosum TaxID=315347 RepID=A0AAF0TBB2_SOLVR|nr:hypothetical protein MTR67_007747 [Solanum verrucosum]